MVRIKRPTEFDEAIANEVLGRIADGETLKRICSEYRMPTTHTVYAWIDGKLHATPLWSGEYARARCAQADGFVEDIIELSDGADDAAQITAQKVLDELPEDASPTQRRRAYYFAKKRTIEGIRLAVDSRKWVAARQHSRKWGDRVLVEHELSDGAEPKMDMAKLSIGQLEEVAALESKINNADAIDAEFTTVSEDAVDEREVKQLKAVGTGS